MIRRWFDRLALWCEEMVFALCCACDGEEPREDPDDDIVAQPGADVFLNGKWISRVDAPPDPAPAMPACVATALRYYEQQLERLSEARRDWALMTVGRKLGDVGAAQRAVRHYERLVDAARDRLDEELATAEAPHA